jgi:ABC-type phosphate transport system ATPase subunit
VRKLDFYYGDVRALKDVSVAVYDRRVNRIHRTIGTREIHSAACVQPHVRLISGAACNGRSYI